MKQIVKQAFAWLAILTCSITLARAEVPFARDLQQDAAQARALNGVVLLVFVGSHCSFCEIALNDFLIPMSGNADYRSRVVMRRVESSGFRDLKDFSGRPVSHRKFAGGYGVRLTPTVLVVDGDGRPLSKAVVGLSTPDYYGDHLDQAINQGIAKVRAQPANLLSGS